MKKLLALSGLLAVLASPAFADTYVNVAHPNAVWDSTTASLYAIGVPGQGQTGLTVIPNAATTNAWTGTNSFSGVVSMSDGLTVSIGNVAIGTTAPATTPLVLAGLGTSAPIGTSATGYLCIDSANNVYRKASCP